MTDPTQLAAEAAAVAASVIPARRRPRRAYVPRPPRPTLTAAEVVARIVRADGVLAAVVYDFGDGDGDKTDVAVHPNAPTIGDLRACAITRLCRSVLLLGNDAVSLDVILDDSVRVVVEALDPDLRRVIAVFVVSGHGVGKSVQRMIRQSRQHLEPKTTETP